MCANLILLTDPMTSVPEKPALRIDFVSDVACPWCAVGLNSLEKALQAVAGEIRVELHFQPFELNPTMAAEGADAGEYLKAKYGMGDEQLAHNRAVIRERGAAVGFDFGDRVRVWNTFDAHRLLYWAGLQGGDAQRALKHAMLQAYHGQGLNVSDPLLLTRLAGDTGLDALEAAMVLREGRYAEEVRTAEAEWQRAGIQSVPSIVLNRQHLIQGGQPPEVFERALRQIADSSRS
jgi:predicted DsbA family dithiol-disulfide isomerase